MEVRKCKERTILMEKKMGGKIKGNRADVNSMIMKTCLIMCVCVRARARVAFHISYCFERRDLTRNR